MLKLAKLPDRTPIRLTIAITPELKSALDDYGAAYERAYGRSEPIAELIPAMLATFLEGDKEFAKARKEAR